MESSGLASGDDLAVTVVGRGRFSASQINDLLSKRACIPGLRFQGKSFAFPVWHCGRNLDGQTGVDMGTKRETGMSPLLQLRSSVLLLTQASLSSFKYRLSTHSPPSPPICILRSR